MLALSIHEPKDFMQHLFKRGTFNTFDTRSVTIHSFAYFEIAGEKPPVEEGEKGGYSNWETLCPYVFHIIKGGEKPRSMKLVFSKDAPEEIHPNAAALFLNMTYENDKLTCTTAASQKNFALDKQMDTLWDLWVKDFFKQNGIGVDIE